MAHGFLVYHAVSILYWHEKNGKKKIAQRMHKCVPLDMIDYKKDAAPR